MSVTEIYLSEHTVDVFDLDQCNFRRYVISRAYALYSNSLGGTSSHGFYLNVDFKQFAITVEQLLFNYSVFSKIACYNYLL